LESVIVTDFQATEAYSSLGLTKTKYSIIRLSVVEMENVISLHVGKKIDMMMKMKFTISSQYKRISKSVLIV
jgi:hypothetical protein